jgi:hypothetical protein
MESWSDGVMRQVQIAREQRIGCRAVEAAGMWQLRLGEAWQTSTLEDEDEYETLAPFPG